MAGKKESKSTVIFLVLVIAMFVIAITASLITRSSKAVPDNPEGTVGNTAGNLYNNGYFCENEGNVVFFSNPYDQGKLYKMNADESEIKLLTNSKAENINTAGKFVYFYMPDSTTSTGLGFIRRVMGIYRIKTNGKSLQCMSRDPSTDMLLVDNFIYYSHYDKKHGFSLYKTDINGSSTTEVSKDVINPSSCYDGSLYYMNQKDNHFLYTYNTETDTASEYLKCNMWNPIRKDNYIYFCDMDNDLRLCRYILSESRIEVITEEMVETFNLNDNYIYYQTNDAKSPALKRCSLDGTNRETVIEGIFNSINITSKYVYFIPFENAEMMYKTPANGNIDVKEFTNARDAIKK